jgi:hypothetical protein
LRFLQSVRCPASAISGAIFTSLYALAAGANYRYPYAEVPEELQRRFMSCIGRSVSPMLSDGVVPTASMLYGEVLWCGAGDHLDVLGHFYGGDNSSHVDWLNSGTCFGCSDFRAMVSAMVGVMLDREGSGAVTLPRGRVRQSAGRAPSAAAPAAWQRGQS